MTIIYVLVNYKGEMENEVKTLAEAEEIVANNTGEFYTDLHINEYNDNAPAKRVELSDFHMSLLNT